MSSTDTPLGKGEGFRAFAHQHVVAREKASCLDDLTKQFARTGFKWVRDGETIIKIKFAAILREGMGEEIVQKRFFLGNAMTTFESANFIVRNLVVIAQAPKRELPQESLEATFDLEVISAVI